MARSLRTTLRHGALLAVAAAGLAGAGPASAACATHTTTNAFAQFGDSADYFLAPDGGFEGGAAGWTLGGASVVTDNETYHVNGAADSKSLQLSAAGQTATSPPFCVDLSNPSMRLFYKTHALGTAAYLQIEAIATSAIGTTDTIMSTISPSQDGVWKPSAVLDLTGPLAAHLHQPGITTAKLKLKFTVINGGGSFQVDDIEVDPFKGG